MGSWSWLNPLTVITKIIPTLMPALTLTSCMTLGWVTSPLVASILPPTLCIVHIDGKILEEEILSVFVQHLAPSRLLISIGSLPHATNIMPLTPVQNSVVVRHQGRHHKGLLITIHGNWCCLNTAWEHFIIPDIDRQGSSYKYVTNESRCRESPDF